MVQPDGLHRMNLRPFGRRDLPNDLLAGRDFAGARLAAEYDVPVGAHRGIAQFLHHALRVVGRNRILPRHLAVAYHVDRLFLFPVIPLAGVNERMLRQSLAGQDRGPVHVVQNLNRGGWSQVSRRRPRAQRPHHFLVRRDFDGLHRRVAQVQLVPPLVEPIVDDRVSVWQARGRLHVGKLVFRRVGGGPFPDRLALPIDLARKLIAGARDQNVPVPQRHGRPAIRHVPRPEYLAVQIVLHHFVRIHVRHQNRPRRRQSRLPELAVHRARVLYRQLELVFDLAAGFVDHRELRRIPVLDVPNAARADRLRGMDFRLLGSVEIPDHLLIQRYFGDAELVREQNVPVRLQHRVGDLTLAGMRVGPDYLAAANNRHPLSLRLARVKEIVLRQPLPGQHRRCVGLRQAGSGQQSRTENGGRQARPPTGHALVQ